MSLRAVSLRAARAEDAAGIAVIWNQIIDETLATFTSAPKQPEALVNAIGAEPGRWFVAEAQGAVLGFACYFQFRGGPGYAQSMEYTIHLAQGARGRGLGRGLLAAVEAGARAEGAHSLYGGVSGANPEGQAFHARMGFARLAVLPEVGRKNGQWLDLHLYHKFL
ncbi:MAG: GNAT family N-acetyltransferase [Roseobacter sp.]|nr:GNAT family N-acetyltransferase [Roseobacter sp.]